MYVQKKKNSRKKYLEAELPFPFKIHPNKMHLKRGTPHRALTNNWYSYYDENYPISRL